MALTKTHGSAWQPVSNTVYFCWSAADGWKPWKLQVTFRKLFISWWKCNNRTCQLPNFWGRRGLKWSLFKQQNMRTSQWLKSNLSPSFPAFLSAYLCLWFSMVFNSLHSTFFHLSLCVSLSLGSSVSLCLLSACILVTAVSKHISCIQIRAGFSATRLYHLALWMQMEKTSHRGYRHPHLSLKPLR